MDSRRFDTLARALGHAANRRTILGALLASLGAPLLPDAAEGKRGGGKQRKRGGPKGKGKDRGRRDRRGERIQAEAACYPGSPCTPGPGKNLGRCDFSESPALKNKNLKGVNLGNASVARGDASGANLQGANLDKTCLVDANLTGASINGSTNIGSAIVCRTTMPDGSVGNAGCNRGTPCCPTCDAANPCPNGEVCCQGRCREGDCCVDADCASNICCANTCCGAGQVCNTNQNPDSCCAPAGSCPVGFCGSVPDGCGGQLQCPCGDGLECCGETCVNTATDRHHCGGCNQPCAAWQTSCQAGVCGPTCAERCPGNCSSCVGLIDGSVVCSSGQIGGAVRCDAAADCVGPGDDDHCGVTSTLRVTNETTPFCAETEPNCVGRCVAILPCS